MASNGLPGAIVSRQASSLHSKGAVNTLVFSKGQIASSENVAVREIASPFDGNTTPVKVYGEVNPTAETEAVPSPAKSKVPDPGETLNVTVISAVNVSSLILAGVPLSLHAEILLAEILNKLQHASSKVSGFIETSTQVVDD